MHKDNPRSDLGTVLLWLGGCQLLLERHQVLRFQNQSRIVLPWFWRGVFLGDDQLNGKKYFDFFPDFAPLFRRRLQLVVRREARPILCNQHVVQVHHDSHCLGLRTSDPL